MRTNLINSLVRLSANTRTDFTSLNYSYSREITWLKSLRPQPKQEWSEEDEKKISELKTLIAQCNGFNKANLQKAFNMIDALHLQPSWKPSDEQMKALEKAFSKEGTAEYRHTINSLYQDLKKLM